MVRFSDYFNLGKSQAELDFVDISLDTDLSVFVDPYALNLESASWFVECSELVIGFFTLVVGSIRDGNERRARTLLAHLHEPNDTRLGLSSGVPRGNGLGAKQAAQLYSRLAGSRAVRTGKLRDLADAELVIPGISSDKISDISTNIIRWPLIRYTQSQCNLHSVPMKCVASGMYWDPGRENWDNSYVELPVYGGKRILMVPKAAVRQRLAVDHQAYFQHFVLDYLQAEHLHAGDSLTTLLKNGKTKVYKKDLRGIYRPDKNFLFEFSEEHPEVLERYKMSLPRTLAPLEDEQIEERQAAPRDLKIAAMIDELRAIPPGRETAAAYHDFILGALNAIFTPSLMYPEKEQEINDKRKRIDVTFLNRAQAGFFHSLNQIHRVHCPVVFVECKNYGREIGNPELDQLAGRFSQSRGQFGFLVCRSIEDRALVLNRCRDRVKEKGEYIVVLNDSDIAMLLELRAQRRRDEIDEFLDKKLFDLIL